MHMQVLLKLYVLSSEDDTLLFSETAADMQNAINAALSYCEVNNMCINTGKIDLLARQCPEASCYHCSRPSNRASENFSLPRDCV